MHDVEGAGKGPFCTLINFAHSLFFFYVGPYFPSSSLCMLIFFVSKGLLFNGFFRFEFHLTIGGSGGWHKRGHKRSIANVSLNNQ